MEVAHLRSAENRNQVPIPIPTLPPGFPVTNGADDVNLLHFSMEAMREIIESRKSARQPINIDPAKAVKTPKRKNVRISKNPQSVAARHRRERISERIGILGEMVPGGTKMDTATILDEAIRYTKFLKRQVKCLEKVRPVRDGYGGGTGLGLGLGFGGPVEAEEVWGYNDYMASCMEMGDVLCQQGQSSSGDSYGEF